MSHQTNSIAYATTNVQTMSSREIAELTEKEHFHVIPDIERMLADLGEAASKLGGSFQAADNAIRRCFNLPKREPLILISGYSVELRARIIDRWQELKAQQAPAVPAFDLNDARSLRTALKTCVEVV